MKNNLRRLDRIIKMFGYDAFYSITPTNYEVSFQGYFNQNIVSRVQSMGFLSNTDTEGYIIFSRGHYRIILENKQPTKL